MATFTVSTNRNFHDTFFNTRAGGDTYNLSGATLTIDGDLRYGPNTSAAAGPLGPVYLDGAYGGTLHIDARAVRLVYFTGGSGTVPVSGVQISQGTTTGRLLGVYTAVNTTPLASGSAMPSSGFAKLRQVSGSFSAGALTNITATASRADVPGWIEVPQVAGNYIYNDISSLIKTTGEWFTVRNSDGSEFTISGYRAQSFQLPASVAYTWWPCVWVETGAGTNVWEVWPVLHGTTTNTPSQDERSKVLFAADTNGTGLTYVGYYSAGGVYAGYMPPTGARIRVPNIYLAAANPSYLYANYQYPAQGGNISGFASNFNIDNTNYAGWKLSVNGAGDTSISNACAAVPINILSRSGRVYITNSMAGRLVDASTDPVLSLRNLSSGCEVSGFFAHSGGAGNQGVYVSGNNCDLTDVKVLSFGRSDSSNAPMTAGVYVNPVFGGTFTNTTVIGAYAAIQFANGTSSDCTITNTKYAYTAMGTVPSDSSRVINFLPSNSVVDGVSFVTSTVNQCQPTDALVMIGDGSTDTKVRNIGTLVAPLNVGTVNPMTAQIKVAGFGSGLKVQRVFTTTTKISNAATAFADAVFEYVGTPYTSSADQTNLISDGFLGKAIFGSRPGTGSVYSSKGMHWFDRFSSATAGEVGVMMTGPSTSSGAMCQVLAGSPVWKAGNTVSLRASDSLQWECPYYAQGHSSVTALTLVGTGTYTATTDYQIDTGSGWSAWKTASAGNLSAETLVPATGTKFKLRVTINTGTASLTHAVFTTGTTLSNIQAVNYPLDPVTITVNGLVANSSVVIRQTNADGTILYQGNESGGQVSTSIDYSGVVHIEARKHDTAPYYKPWTALQTIAGNTTVTATQILDS